MDTSGITLQQHRALSGEISCTVFDANVRVPDTTRVSEVDGGWKVIVDALAGERITMGNNAAELTASSTTSWPASARTRRRSSAPAARPVARCSES
ncbi:hypothetical protein [Streptomyces coelicoflavus]|uniref:hypothetical protein n=1 Tax=Streptomyces coelicoflavus TaxID=285562 RepID=UPI003F49CAAC